MLFYVIMMVGSYNSYNNMVDGYIVLNQMLLIIDQFNVGIWFFDFDVYMYGIGYFVVCYVFGFVCGVVDCDFDVVMQEIVIWMDVYLIEILVILLEDYWYDLVLLFFLVWEEWRVQVFIKIWFDIFFIGVVKKFQFVSGGMVFCQRMLEEGMCVFLFFQNQLVSDFVVIKIGNLQFVFVCGGCFVENFFFY